MNGKVLLFQLEAENEADDEDNSNFLSPPSNEPETNFSGFVGTIEEEDESSIARACLENISRKIHETGSEVSVTGLRDGIIESKNRLADIILEDPAPVQPSTPGSDKNSESGNGSWNSPQKSGSRVGSAGNRNNNGSCNSPEKTLVGSSSSEKGSWNSPKKSSRTSSRSSGNESWNSPHKRDSDRWNSRDSANNSSSDEMINNKPVLTSSRIPSLEKPDTGTETQQDDRCKDDPEQKPEMFAGSRDSGKSSEKFSGEEELTSMDPQNEFEPQPSPSKPRPESRVSISSASSCTLNSGFCDSPEPKPNRSPSGGYEDLLNVIERLEDELDGRDKHDRRREVRWSSKSSATTTATTSNSSSATSSSTGSPAKTKNASKVK